MRKHILLAIGTALLLGCAGAPSAETSPSPAAGGKADSVGPSGLGGFDYSGGCYTGAFVPDQVCTTRTSSATGVTANNDTVKVTATATDRYQDTRGEDVLIAVDLTLEDAGNYFDPEAVVPVIGRGVVCGYHRECSYYVVSQAVSLNRVTGTRQLTGHFELTVHNGVGAEYTETVEKLEVLVPGIGQLLTLPLTR